jgi:hypothetical protein
LRLTGRVGETGVTPRREQGSTVVPIAAAAVLALIVIVITVLLSSGGSDDGFDLRTSATIPSGHAADAVIHDGDTVRGSGAVVVGRGGKALFCPPVASIEGQTCPLGIALTGSAAHKLVGMHSATITGTYHVHPGQRSIAVTDVKPFDDRRSHLVGRDVVPCTAPDGGWPRGEVDMSAADSYKTNHPRDIVLVAILRPSPTSAVAYVVTAGDPRAAGTALTKVYGQRVCVVQSPFSVQQIDAAKRLITAHVGRSITDVNSGGGPTIDSHGNVEIEAQVPIIDASFARLVDAQPAGLVQLTVWLRPS